MTLVHQATTPRVPESIRVQEVACNNCGSTKFEVVTEGRDHEYPHTTSATFRLVRCECGLVYLNPRPATSELDTIYPPDYYAYQIIERRQRDAKGKGSASLLRRFMDAQAIRRFSAYAKLVEKDAPGPYRILDIGCGDGTVLNQWKGAFSTDIETHGIEMNEAAAAIASAQGHAVTAKRIEDTPLAPDAFQLIYSFHVVEHVEDPTSFMRAIHTALRPDGLVIIDTPNVETKDFYAFPKHWGAYHFPRHWNLYDAKTFTALAERTGFEVLRVEYMPSAVFWNWTFHSMIWARSPKLADRLFPPVDIFLRGGPWIWTVMSAFTALDTLILKATGRTACMRILLKKKP